MADTRLFGPTPEVHDYLIAHGTAPDAILRDLIDETMSLGGVSRMQIVPEQGAFMTVLTSLIGARHAITCSGRNASSTNVRRMSTPSRFDASTIRWLRIRDSTS